MVNDTVVAKMAVRKQMLALRAAMSAGQRAEAAERLAGQADALLRLAGPGIVSGFVAFRDEIDPAPLLRALHRAGARLALPRVAGPHLTFHAWAPGDPLVPGRYGIDEPLADAPPLRPALMLLPMLAFDRAGNRLGYGGGFFDRVLADHRPEVTVGLAYGAQEVALVPVEPHDQPLRFVLTEAGLIDCRAGAGA